MSVDVVRRCDECRGPLSPQRRYWQISVEVLAVPAGGTYALTDKEYCSDTCIVSAVRTLLARADRFHEFGVAAVGPSPITALPTTAAARRAN